MRVHGRVALITGSGSGIGQATARLFAQEGAQVVVADLLRDRAEGTARQIRADGGDALAIEVNVTVAEAVNAMVAQALAAYGRIDILVNNAGAYAGDDILEIDEETWDFNLNAVLKSAYLCSRAVLPSMIEQRRGVIVNIASVNGLTGLGGEAYSAGKAGMINLTQNMAIRVGRFGIRVNSISPGTVRTPIWKPILEQEPQTFERLVKWYPLGRVGEPEDIARAALFLVSDDAAWITGINLVVDGGLMAGRARMSAELGGRSVDD